MDLTKLIEILFAIAGIGISNTGITAIIWWLIPAGVKQNMETGGVTGAFKQLITIVVIIGLGFAAYYAGFAGTTGIKELLVELLIAYMASAGLYRLNFDKLKNLGNNK
jgi:hypothetical protein